MRSNSEQQVTQDRDSRESYKELQVLTEVEAFPDITQRVLSQRVGIALGLTNVVLKSLIRKGYIRSQKASWKRWIYALTPEGASHKIRLIVAYVRRCMEDYRRVRLILREQLEPLSLHSESRVAIFGTTEFSELVYLGLKELGAHEIDVFIADPSPGQAFLGMPVHGIETLDPSFYDRVLIAVLDHSPDETLVRILAEKGQSDKLVAFFLNKGRGVHL